MRPVQWSKNAVVFAALIFGRAFTGESLWKTLLAFMAFCLISSATYVVNDLADIERDRLHPMKRFRPLAAGEIRPDRARIFGAALAIAALIIAYLASPTVSLVLVIYTALMLGYSFYLKQFVLLDVFVISAGFILRAVAGGAAIHITLSPWLILCSMLLSLFLGFCKRRHELLTLDKQAGDHRISLRGYTLPFLDQLILISATCSIMGYAIYSFTAESVPADGSMMLSVPFVIFAIMRYLYLVYVRNLGGTPEMLLVRDRQLFGSILLWGLSVVIILVVA